MLQICLEHAAGGTLSDRIDETAADGRRFACDVAASWIAQIASAVAYMHSSRVLHRDLSAKNVFLSCHGDGCDVKVGDFGLSHTSLDSLSLPLGGRTVCGTPNYFAPEMIRGERYGAPADAWAVGLLAHEILTLRLPFAANSLATLLRQILSGEYDRSLLVRAPYPVALKAVASPAELLHIDPTQRLTLEAMLERDEWRLAPTPDDGGGG